MLISATAFGSITFVSPTPSSGQQIVKGSTVSARFTHTGTISYGILQLIQTGGTVVATTTSAIQNFSYNFSTASLALGTYYFKIYDAANPSNFAVSPTFSISVIQPPSGLDDINNTINGFTISWNAAPGASSYAIDVSTSSTFASLDILNNVTVSSTTRVLNNLSQSTPVYYARVRSVNTSGTSVNSTMLICTLISPPPVTAPVTNVTENSFTLNWQAIATATHYLVDVSTKQNFSTYYSSYQDYSVSGTSLTLSYLFAKTSYYYRVRAVNAGGPSAYSVAQKAVNLDRNYVKTVSVRRRGVTANEFSFPSLGFGDKSEEYLFVDGLGRPSQKVLKQQAALGNDIVQPIVYNSLGIEDIKYLPYVNGDEGWYKFDFKTKDNSQYATNSSPQYNYYQVGGPVASDPNPYAVTVYEKSPLRRVIKQGAPGAAWQPDYLPLYTSTDRTQKFDYQYNSATEVLKWVHMPASAASPNSFGLVNAGSVTSPVKYAASELSKFLSKDEQNNEVIEFRDMYGRTVLKKVQVAASLYAETYYVYDDYDNIVCVLPPEAVSKLATEYFHSGSSWGTKEAFLKRWAFRYKFDSRNRLVSKQVPGAGQVYMVYDSRDRLVLTQDSVQRASTPKYWSFTKYDQLNRPVAAGIKDTAALVTQVQMQDRVTAHYAKPWTKLYETFSSTAGNVHGYTNKSYPVVTTAGTLDANRYLTVTFYDSYTFKSLWNSSYNYVDEDLSCTANGATYNQPDAEFTTVKGQVTGTKVKVLDGGITGGYTWLRSVSYYDDDYRVIQTISDNYKGGTDRTTNVYDFTGKVLTSKFTHSESDVTWKDMVGVKQEGNKLIAVSGPPQWGFGAASVQQLGAGQDGWFEMVVSELTSKVIGFNDSNSGGTSNSDINYVFQLYNGTLYIQENASLRGTVTGLVPGDVLRMERVGTIISFKRNGIPITTSALTPSSSALFIDNSFHLPGNTLVGVRSSFSTSVRNTIRRFEYDHAGRLINTWHKVDSNPTEILLSKNEYNELGQLIDKKLHSTVATASDAKQSVDYRYNIRGWLTSINNAALSNDGATNNDTGDFFGMNLAYNTTDLGVGNTPLFNGNISGITWSNNQGLGTTKQNGYVYAYDPLNRIISSAFKEKSSSWTAPSNSAFAETGFTYDLNGNIQTLQRNDKRGSGWMDNLVYNYGTGTTRSNKLLKVEDTGDDYAGFIDGNPSLATDFTTTTDDYRYDPNGNMINDRNKGIGTSITDNINVITYNYLNLPETVTKGGNTIRYIYGATGRKLAQVTSFGGTSKQTDYAGEYQYKNDVLQFIAHEEGRIVMAETKTVYQHSADVVTGITASNATLAPVTQNGTEKYVRATANGTVARTGMYPIGNTLSVNAGETYRIRAKGYRTGANAVYLLIKVNGADMNWPGATLANGATAESWTEQTVTIPASPAIGTLEVGVVWNTVTSGQQFFLNAFEIIKVSTSAAPEYQYNLKDHLGNNRLTFTAKVETLVETATLENANAATEQSQFLRFAEAKKIQSFLFDKTNGSFPTTTTGYAQRLNGSANERYGLGKSISVMPGDVVSAEVYAKYIDPVNTNWTTALSTLLSQIAAGTAAPGIIVDGVNYSGSTSSFPFTGAATQNTANSSETGPKAYLNWLVFDRDFNFMLSESGYDRISTAPKENGQDVAHELLYSPAITIKQPGYVYFYLSNEESTPLEVYFDNFKVIHTKSPVIQTDDYYPFGLAFNSYSRENAVDNDYKYNGQELQDELDLNWYHYTFRMYSPEIGRFISVDPLSDKFAYNSPYAFAENKLGMGVEFEGLELVGWDLIPYVTAAYYGSKSKFQGGVSNIRQSTSGTASYNNSAVPLETRKMLQLQQFSQGVNQVYGATAGVGHFGLDVLGTVPLVGEVFDAANAGWYAAEGNYGYASLSALSIIPIIGDASKGAKYAFKADNFTGELVDGADNLLGAAFKNSDGIEIGFLAEKGISKDGKTLSLSDVVMYGLDAKGNELKNKIGSTVLGYRDVIAKWAKSQGFETLNISGTRAAGSSSAKPGKQVNVKIDLTKIE
jgi:RHS repeat-associated protein